MKVAPSILDKCMTFFVDCAQTLPNYEEVHLFARRVKRLQRLEVDFSHTLMLNLTNVNKIKTPAYVQLDS